MSRRTSSVHARSARTARSNGWLIAAALAMAVVLAACTSTPDGPNLLEPDQADMAPIDSDVDEPLVVGWVTQGNASLAAVSVDGATAARIVASKEDPIYIDDTRTVRVGTTPIAIVAGHSYAGNVEVKAVESGSPVRCEIRFYDQGGVIIDTVPGSESADASRGWTRLTCEATAPEGAATSSLRVHIAEADYGDEHLIDGASLVDLSEEPPAETAPPVETTSSSVPAADSGDHAGHEPAPEAPAGGCGSGEGVACESSNMSGSMFIERFNGDPSGPQPVMNRLDRWFAQPIMQGPLGWGFAPEPMVAQHGEDCSAPPAGHTIDSFDETVYSCKDHVMTAINPPSAGTSSAVVALKPNHMVDLSKGEATIKVDVSTLSPSKGDWWEIWITPWEDQLIAPTDHWFHQAGPPRRALFLQVVDLDQKKFWSHKFFDNYRFSGGLNDFWKAPDIRSIVSESDTRRDTYEIRMTKSKVTLLVESSETGEMVKVSEFAIPNGGFWSDQAVVQFQQSNYEPEMNGKHGCSDPCPKVTKPATWHWDNVEISPAVPYELIGVREYMVWFGSKSKELNFDDPAPAGARMLFTAQSRGNAPELSFDGVDWVKATAVRPPNDPPIAGFGGDPDLLTYSVPVPEGATSATIRGKGGCEGCDPLRSWAAFNFHLIAR